MLCCTKNLDLVVKFICSKIGSNGMDFDAKNDEGYNALMLAVLNVTDDNTVAMIAKLTKDKNAVTNVSKIVYIFIFIFVLNRKFLYFVICWLLCCMIMFYVVMIDCCNNVMISYIGWKDSKRYCNR